MLGTVLPSWGYLGQLALTTATARKKETARKRQQPAVSRLSGREVILQSKHLLVTGWETLICCHVTEARQEVLRPELPMQWLTQGPVQLSLESMGAFQLVLQREFVQQSPSHAGNYLSCGKRNEKKPFPYSSSSTDKKWKGPGKIMWFQPAKKTLQESEDWDKQIFPFPDYWSTGSGDCAM